MKTFILSLPKDVDRRAHMTEQLPKAGITDYEFVDGIDCRKLTVDELDTVFDVRRFRRLHGVDPMPGEVGCAIGHHNIWQACLDNGEGPWLVLEDDVAMEDGFISDIEKMGSLISKTDVASVIVASFFAYYKECDGNVKPASYVCGTFCYIINKAAAMLLYGLGRPHYLADDWQYFAKIGLDLKICVHPHIKHDFSFASSIPQRSEWSEKMSGFQKIKSICRALPREIKYKLGFCRLYNPYDVPLVTEGLKNKVRTFFKS